jgi:hypothetical protein
MLSHLLSRSEGEIPEFMAFIRQQQDSFEHEIRKEGEFWMNLIDKAIDEFIGYAAEKAAAEKEAAKKADDECVLTFSEDGFTICLYLN